MPLRQQQAADETELSTAVVNRRGPQENFHNLGSPEPTPHRRLSVGGEGSGATVPAYIMIARQNQQQGVDSDDEADERDYIEAEDHLQHLHENQPVEKEKQKLSMLEKLDKRFSHMVNIETSVADSGDFPIHW